jgi:type IV secretory pathway VirJ component
MNLSNLFWSGLPVLVLASLACASEDTLMFGPFRAVHVYRETQTPKQVVLFVSGEGGWSPGVVDMAREWVKADAWILGIDFRVYSKSMGAAHGVCAYSAADFEGLSHFAQKKLGLKNYQVPMLIGYSSGATLVYGVLAQAPQGTFSGAISLGFCPDLGIAKPLCNGDGLRSERRSGGQVGTHLLPTSHLQVPWIAMQDLQDRICSPDSTRKFLQQVPGGEMIALPKGVHGFSVPKHWLPEFRRAFDKIAASGPKTDSASTAVFQLPDLPLVEVPATTSDQTGEGKTTFAILITGDGGWAGIDRDLAHTLAQRGIGVIGWNSLKYLWKRKKEADAAADLEKVIRHYLTAWKKEQVLLLGYSLGADILPAMAARLPKDVLASVAGIALLGVETNYDMEFHVTEWIPGKAEGLPILPEVKKLQGKRIVCLYGKTEKGSLCPTLDPTLARIVAFSGGHHFGGDYQALADSILAQ